MRRFLWFILTLSILSLGSGPAWCSQPQATLAELKKLEIICYVPSWLPKGFRLRSVEIGSDEPGPDEDKNHRLPLYSIEYGNELSGPGGPATFTIESAREGIGDRNIMETDDSEETTIPSPFGPMYLIYTPKGQGQGRKAEIKANWVPDANMKSEKAKDPQAHPARGRYHGFSAAGLTVAEFSQIIQSLHPIRR